MIKHALSLSLALFMVCATAFSAQLNKIEAIQQSGKTVLYITVQGAFTHKLFTLPQPNRVVLDLNNTILGMSVNTLKFNNSLIQGVRSGSPDHKNLRLVFDVRQNVHVRSLPWNLNGHFNGLQLELSAVGPSPKVSSVVGHSRLDTKQWNTVVPAISQSVRIKKPPVKIPNSPSNKYLRDVVVVLDAGHGGKDPGAHGPNHSKEKHVVLAITLKLKQLIDRQPGMRAVLTRSGDYYVGLRQRLDIARKYNGDVFVSIHADAFNNPHSNGASVFALSQSGATSEAARWIAEKENYSELGGVNLGQLDDINGVVRSVLIDLSQTATINAGLQMGGRVLSQLNHFTNLHNNKVEQARFVVLKSPDTPSILVETGFISNPREERNLNNPNYQTRLSQAIFQGIKAYFWDNPPQGSRIEALTSNHFHIVRKGEQLPTIASRYHVTTQAMQAMNGLNDRLVLKPGQKLVIPSTWS